MLRNLLRAGVLSLAFFSSAPTSQPTFSRVSDFPPDFWPVTIYTHNYYVEKISCDEGSGTGFKLADGRWASANHVTSLHNCKIDGLPIQVTYADPKGDFSLFDVPGDQRWGGLQVQCAGYFDKGWYFGVGHGRGDPFPQVVTVKYSALYTYLADNGWGILEGARFVPGMSGGVVLDGWGRAVGVVNAFGIFMKISMSRQLRDTVVCQG